MVDVGVGIRVDLDFNIDFKVCFRVDRKVDVRGGQDPLRKPQMDGCVWEDHFP